MESVFKKPAEQPVVYHEIEIKRVGSCVINVIDGVPFMFLSFRGQAANLRISGTRQLVFIPRRYFNNDGIIVKNPDLRWFFRKKDTIKKILLAKAEKGGFRWIGHENTM